MVPVGDKIKALAKAKDLSIPQFAKALGYERADNFYSIASGRSKPGWEIIEAIARAFPDVNLEWLLRDDPQMLLSPAHMNDQESIGTVQDGTVQDGTVQEPQLALLNAELRHKEAQLAEKDKRLADKDKIIELLEKMVKP